MTQRTFIIIGIVLVLLGVGGYFFFAQKPTTTPTPTPQFPGEGQPVMGGGGQVPTPPADEGEVFVPGSGATLPRLYELHKVPVAGATFVETKDRKGAVTSITARYIERGLGHIYDTPLATLAETRIANDTRARLSEALWGSGGKSVVVRFLDDADPSIIKTRIVNLGASSSDGFIQTEEVFLPDYIPFMAVANDGADKIFYFENGAASAAGTTATFKNTARTNVFSSSFTEWLPEFPNRNLVTLTTRPSVNIPGHMFFLNPTTKAVTKTLSGISGLTTLTSRDGKTVLYSESKGQGVELWVYDVVKKESRPLSLQTLPEKCVWSAKNLAIAFCAVPQTLTPAQYPDQWYQGLVSFTDDIWRIDTKTAIAERVFTGSFDIINPVLSSDEKYILFMNKVTGTPWVYRLAEEIPPAPVTPPAQTGTSTVQTTPVSPSPIEGMTRIK